MSKYVYIIFMLTFVSNMALGGTTIIVPSSNNNYKPFTIPERKGVDLEEYFKTIRETIEPKEQKPHVQSKPRKEQKPPVQSKPRKEQKPPVQQNIRTNFIQKFSKFFQSNTSPSFESDN